MGCILFYFKRLEMVVECGTKTLDEVLSFFCLTNLALISAFVSQMARLGYSFFQFFNYSYFPTTLCRDRESNSRQSCTFSRDFLRPLYRLSNMATVVKYFTYSWFTRTKWQSLIKLKPYVSFQRSNV